MAETAKQEGHPDSRWDDQPDEPDIEMPDERTVPYDRFKKVNEEAKAEKAARAKIEARLQELEDQNKSEADRERAQRERLESEAERLKADLTEREQRLVNLERSSWIRAAASEAKFHDPDDAVALVDLSQVESEADARKAVKSVAGSKKHLVQAEQAPQVGRVLANGQPVQADSDQDAAAAYEQEAKQFVEELKAASRGGWSS